MIKKFICIILLITIAFTYKGYKNFNKIYNVEVLKEGGYGVYPKKGDQLEVHYTGYLLDGTKFDSSKDRDETFKFRVGNGRVIACWDAVMQKMTIGDIIRVTCPSEKAYGSNGAGESIPPNADLVFEIELFAFGDHPKKEEDTNKNDL